MKPLLVPPNLAEETELLEALEWDEEALSQVIEKCRGALSEIETGSQAAKSLRDLHEELVAERGECVARLVITLFLKRAIQYSAEEIEA